MQFINKIRNLNRLRKAARSKPKIYVFPERFAYIPIPKCATRSMYDLLGEWTKNNYNGQDFDSFGYHAQPEKLKKVTEKLYTFAIVRNPMDRLYSAYKNKVLTHEGADKKDLFKKHNIERNISFEDFIISVCDIPDSVADRHFRSQTWYLTSNQELMSVDLIRLENIQQDWKRVAAATGLILPSKLNATQSSPVPVQTKEIQARIKDRYREDFNLLGY